MNTPNISRVLRAALIGIALAGTAGIARAEVKDYEFKLVEPTTSVGKDRIVTVRPTGTLVQNRVLRRIPTYVGSSPIF